MIGAAWAATTLMALFIGYRFGQWSTAKEFSSDLARGAARIGKLDDLAAITAAAVDAVEGEP